MSLRAPSSRGERRARTRAAALVCAAALASGCSTIALPPPTPPAADICTDLGWFSYVVAEYKGRGDTRSDQIRWANRSIARGTTRKTALQLIHFVYSVDVDPIEAARTMRDGCRPGEPGTVRIALRGTR